MSSSIYSKLAVTNLKNNRKTYLPYILTAVLTVMMFYIMDGLYHNSNVDGNVKFCLQYATYVITIFSVIFLFYTNSFLLKRRKKEIGIYNVLGMGKRHIARMLAIETGITAGTSIVAGVVLGVIFSKLMYLILLKLLRYDVGMEYEWSSQVMVQTVILFLGIFILTLLYNLLQIKLANPVELVRGTNQGEREPKSKWLLTIFGVVMLGIGYGIAQTVKAPLAALGLFFIAVVCVILGTYALFTAGSIVLLKMLRKNKKYYYQTKHFTSVSGMLYRMKQNAVGLANICILSTMVLVMISTTVSLYAGMDDILKTRFPYDVEIERKDTAPEALGEIETIVKEETGKYNVKPVSEIDYRYGTFAVLRENDTLQLREVGSFSATDMCEMYMIPLDDYNRMEGRTVSLAEDEVLVFYNAKDKYGKETMQIADQSYRVVEELDEISIAKKSGSNVVDAYYVIFEDAEQIQSYIDYVYQNSDMEDVWKSQYLTLRYKYIFDLEGEEEDCVQAMKEMQTRIYEAGCGFEGRRLSEEGFYILYGSLLFIGIYLGAMFLMATVLIIYYKQISEGYEDRDRYQIMQKVGMSLKEVKSSIQSQILTVFFLPLIVAVIHIAVAFKVITKLLAILNLVNIPLFFGCTVATVAVFAVFYAVVFAVTAKEYYRIVK